MAKRHPSRLARKAASARKAEPRPTRELARTWVVTVINPILQGIRREKVLLTQKNWSWRYITGSFEYLWPIEYLLDASYRDNLSAFCDWYGEASRAIRAHDSKLSELAALCNIAFRRLFETSNFPAAVQEANTLAAKKGIDLEGARGAVPADQWPRLIGEYLINNVRTLPEHYTTAPFWKEAGEIVLRVRNSKDLRDQFGALERAGTELMQAAESAEHALLSIRQTYTRQFGIPPVPLPHSLEHSGA